MSRCSDGRAIWLLLGVLTIFAITGCDNRGAKEREWEAAVAQEKDPQIRAVGELMGGRKIAQAQDRQMASMTPQERGAVQTLMGGTNNPSSSAPAPSAPAPAQSPLQLGITQSLVLPVTSQRLGIPAGTGIYVNAVENNSPAAAAGVLPGDVIVSANALQISPSFDLNKAKFGLGPGSQMNLRVVRANGTYDIPVVLGR